MESFQTLIVYALATIGYYSLSYYVVTAVWTIRTYNMRVPMPDQEGGSRFLFVVLVFIGGPLWLLLLLLALLRKTQGRDFFFKYGLYTVPRFQKFKAEYTENSRDFERPMQEGRVVH